MNISKRNRIQRPRSEPPTTQLSSGIRLLLSACAVQSGESIVALADKFARNVDDGYESLVAIDERLGGVGLHNVNKRIGKDITGGYRGELRPLFRPIQYVQSYVTGDDLVWDARRIVQDSCLHVENALKFRCNLDMNASLGVLLRQKMVFNSVDTNLLKILRTLNDLVYGAAKHSVEEVNIDAHRFTPADSLAVYLICRWAGVKLLEPTGLFMNWERFE